MNDLYSNFKKIEEFYSNIDEYKSLLNNIDYHFELFTDMYNYINSFITIPTAFNSTSNNIYQAGMISEETLNKHFNNLKKISMIDLSVLLNNCKQTLYSFRKCIEIVNISDAITLFRKFKDDLLLFIYFDRLGSPNFNDYDTIDKLKFWNDCVNDAYNWENNSMSKVYYTKVIKFLQTEPLLIKFDEGTNCFNYLINLTKKLNNFAHSNGISFINNYNPIYNKEKTLNLFRFINKHLEKVCAYLLTILFTISPQYLMSSDYTDYMDAGAEPPTESQYWVAQYLQDYIDSKLNSINPKLKEFLIENNPMNIK